MVNSSDRSYEYLYGINCVQIAINTNRRELDRLYVVDSEAAKLSPRVSNILTTCRKLGLPVELVSREALDRTLPGQPHQNVLLKCSPLDYVKV